jgi:hypothetical protein
LTNRNENKAESIAGNFVAFDDGRLFFEVPCYLSANRPFRNRHVKHAVLIADRWISFVAQFVKIWIIDPNILRKLKLAHEACTQNECRNATIHTVFGRTFWQGRSVRSRHGGSFFVAECSQPCREDSFGEYALQGEQHIPAGPFLSS